MINEDERNVTPRWNLAFARGNNYRAAMVAAKVVASGIESKLQIAIGCRYMVSREWFSFLDRGTGTTPGYLNSTYHGSIGRSPDAILIRILVHVLMMF